MAFMCIDCLMEDQAFTEYRPIEQWSKKNRRDKMFEPKPIWKWNEKFDLWLDFSENSNYPLGWCCQHFANRSLMPKRYHLSQFDASTQRNIAHKTLNRLYELCMAIARDIRIIIIIWFVDGVWADWLGVRVCTLHIYVISWFCKSVEGSIAHSS